MDTPNELAEYQQREKERLKNAVGTFGFAMYDRLSEKVQQGKSGWDNPELYEQIKADMVQDVKNNPDEKLIDIANRAMLLWFLQYLEAEDE